MAKKKKSRGNQVAEMAAPSSSGRMHVGIDSAENGFVVRVSGDSGGKHPSYHEKTLVATSPHHAMRVAASHLHGMVKKMHGKKGSKKKASAKKF